MFGGGSLRIWLGADAAAAAAAATAKNLRRASDAVGFLFQQSALFFF